MPASSAAKVIVVAACGALMAVPAVAQSGAKRDSLGEEAVDAVTQPLSDLNLRSKDIPLLLQRAQAAPYDLTGVTECDALRSEVAALDDVLGPDADEPEESASVLAKGLQAGGSVLGGLIPFRGLVREISGARAEEARWRDAIYGGVARRSFLKGYMAGKQCRTADQVSVDSAREVLGLDPIE